MDFIIKKLNKNMINGHYVFIKEFCFNILKSMLLYMIIL